MGKEKENEKKGEGEKEEDKEQDILYLLDSQVPEGAGWSPQQQ